jgi:predicted dehydrogenase
MTNAIIPAAVIGVGRMGGHHARNYAALTSHFKLVAVVDRNPDAASRAAETYNCRAFATVEELLAANMGVKAATVALPTIYHRAAAEPLLAAGLDVLVEKPLSPTVEDGRAIVQTAKKHARILQVGHTERFNPVFVALKKHVVHPKFVEVHRISPMTFRSIDVGVVLDMMIHDLDIVASLTRSPVKDVRAVGVRVLGDHEDICNARIEYQNGCVANITASRLALKTERKMRLFSPDCYVSVDYAKKIGSMITRTANEEQLALVREQLKKGEDGGLADLAGIDYTQYVKYEELKVAATEPVRAELENFHHAITTRTPPEVPGEDGLTAVETAIRIQQRIAEHKWDGVQSDLPYPPTA